MKLKRYLVALLVAAAALFSAGQASALSGAGAVTAVKSGAFIVKYFNGTQAGIDSAVAYCTPSGTVSLGPGLEALSPTGPVPSTVLVIRTGSGGWTLTGNGATGRIPRLGPSSTTTTGRALRVVDGSTFPATRLGLQAALTECGAAGGGRVLALPDLTIDSVLVVPASVHLDVGRSSWTFTGNSGVILGSFAEIVGSGYNTTQFTPNSSYTGQFIIRNADTTGAQQYCAVKSLSINGNKSLATLSRGIFMKGVGQPSIIRDVVVFDVSGCGIWLEGVTTSAFPPGLDNVWVSRCDDYNIRAKDPNQGLAMTRVTSESPGGSSKAAIYLDGTAAGTRVGPTWLHDIHVEGLGAGEVGILSSNWHDLTIDGVMYAGSGGTGDLVKITGSATDAENITILNAYDKFNALATTINDVTNGVTFTNQVPFYSTAGLMAGIQPTRRGTDIASASTIAPNQTKGSVFALTGTTTVTTITGAPAFLYRVTTFVVTTALQFTDGSNLNLNGNFVGNATGGDDILRLMWDGTNWSECSRSLN